ncbi:MAG: Y-family DNA polymerase [Pseudomonadota bacterium]
MVCDVDPPSGLRWLFLDLNSYFASVEQNEDPGLRGRPVAVLPLASESTCVIAASYEAKAFGIKTGTPVWEARRLCPGIILLPGRHDLYVAYHHRILAEIDRHIPITHVCSIDEVACRLDQRMAAPDKAVALARRIKAGLLQAIGPMVRASIGLAPSMLLAKIATDMEKPDGLVTLAPAALPGPLLGLALSDLPGIGERLARRLRAAGVVSLADFWALTPKRARLAWGSVVGERFWYELHGHDLPRPDTARRSVSHSQVLAPEVRPFSQARLVGRRLTQKAASRLRRLDLCAQTCALSLRTAGGGKWSGEARFPASQSNFTFLAAFERLWREAERRLGRVALKQVGVWLGRLSPATHDEAGLLKLMQPQASLLAARQRRLSQAMDQLNQRFGRDCVLLGMPARQLAHYTGTKIAFTRIPDQEEFRE